MRLTRPIPAQQPSCLEQRKLAELRLRLGELAARLNGRHVGPPKSRFSHMNRNFEFLVLDVRLHGSELLLTMSCLGPPPLPCLRIGFSADFPSRHLLPRSGHR